MIQQRLQEWIAHPELLDRESLGELRGLLARYPYFQTARLLYLKNLFLLQDPDFKTELQKSALYVADLSLLFYYIEGERFVIGKHGEKTVEKNAESTDRTLDLIDRFLSELPAQTAKELSIPQEVSIDYTSILLQEDAQPEVTVPLKNQELIDDFIEKQNLQSSVDEHPDSEQTVDLEEETEDTEPEKVEGEELDESYFTETLAKIYVKQHRYDKALEIIEKLNLKYPKKNIYFADQIRFLQKLIINAKSK
ncbi:tetratricopeptide repeat protein [Phocaeicola sp.]|uniref:tetratricopeptide repeat protein n=1 Tax=Phocaeicola sp. TaxID=2773926 RepID=UPI0038635393